MPSDDMGDFLKFLDDVSLQLACLLNIDRERDLKQVYGKQRLLSNQSRTKAGKSNRMTSTCASKKQQEASNKQPSRARGRRRAKQPREIDAGKELGSEQSRVSIELHSQQQHHMAQIQDLQPIKPLSLGAESHSLEAQLSLGLTDELSIEHGSSISPATHLSPLEPSPIGHFNHTISQQHYYNSSRVVLDAFHLHEEFSSQDTVPIANDQSHQLIISPEHHHHNSMVHHQHQHQQQQQQRQQQQQPGPNHHDQQQRHLAQDTNRPQEQHLSNVSNANFSSIPTMSDCYPQPPIIHHHGPQPQHHQHQQPQQHPQQHQGQQHIHQSNLQYQVLDHQWLNSSSLTGDSNIHILEAHTHNHIDQVGSISPGPNQNLEHVQFGSSLYQHNYYGHQSEHLDPFHQITSDDFNANSSSMATNDNHMHRLQQDQQHSHLNNASLNNNYNQIHQSQTGNHQLPTSGATYVNEHSHNTSSGHHQASHHPHTSHHQVTQMPHLVSGMETNNVIIQDINLASATWNSSEDLYGI